MYEIPNAKSDPENVTQFIVSLGGGYIPLPDRMGGG